MLQTNFFSFYFNFVFKAWLMQAAARQCLTITNSRLSFNIELYIDVDVLICVVDDNERGILARAMNDLY